MLCFINASLSDVRSHHSHMHGVSVCVTVHRHRADAHLLGCTHDTTRNLSPIGNQHLLYSCSAWKRHS